MLKRACAVSYYLREIILKTYNLLKGTYFYDIGNANLKTAVFFVSSEKLLKFNIDACIQLVKSNIGRYSWNLFWYSFLIIL